MAAATFDSFSPAQTQNQQPQDPYHRQYQHHLKDDMLLPTESDGVRLRQGGGGPPPPSGMMGRGALPQPKPIVPYSGRLGANGLFSLGRDNEEDRKLLEKYPDAAPWVPLVDDFKFQQFLDPDLWKAAVIEGVATGLLTFLTVIFPISMAEPFKNNPYGPIIGSGIVIFILPILIFSSGPVSGGQINPFITISTFFGRLTTFPRCVLYVGFQMLGAALAGLMIRASLDTRDFITPGCYMDTSQVSLGSAFAIEFMGDLALIFLSFGVGLDPRQQQVFGPTLGPIFCGVALAVCNVCTSMVRPGYLGFAGNPARCFGAMVGSHFETYHWIHWIGPISAAMANGLLYYLVPPYQMALKPKHP